MRWIACILCLLVCLLVAPSALAHPLDDQAQMASEIAVQPGQRLKFTIDFRYLSAIASMTEFANGLDADMDGTVTPTELENRYEDLVNRLFMDIGFALNGERIYFEPDFDSFEFNDLNNTPRPPGVGGIPTADVRIHYRFVFWWAPDEELPPGEYTVEYRFSGTNSVLHTPEQQMVAIDDRKNPRERITDVRYEITMGVYPRLVFPWRIFEPAQPSPDTPGIEPAPPEPPVSADPPGALRELPAWLTFTAGLMLALYGIGTAARRAFTPPKGKSPRVGFAGAMLFVLVGAAVMLAALVRLGHVPPFQT